MKKNRPKLVLKSETVRVLNTSRLVGVVAGQVVVRVESDTYEQGGCSGTT